MVGSKGLAQGAGIKFLDLIIGEISEALVAIIVSSASFSQPLFQLDRIGIDCHLYLVDDGAKIGMEAGVQDLSEVLEVKAFIRSGIRDAYPGNVALPNMLDA